MAIQLSTPEWRCTQTGNTYLHGEECNHPLCEKAPHNQEDA